MKVYFLYQVAYISSVFYVSLISSICPSFFLGSRVSSMSQQFPFELASFLMPRANQLLMD
jgi:hypothetical protein